MSNTEINRRLDEIERKIDEIDVINAEKRGDVERVRRELLQQEAATP